MSAPRPSILDERATPITRAMLDIRLRHARDMGGAYCTAADLEQLHALIDGLCEALRRAEGVDNG